MITGPTPPSPPLAINTGAVALDWVNLAIGLVGLAVTLIGFWIALVQIRKTKTAAEAATAAVTVGTVRIRYNQLLTLVPQLQNLEIEMDTAVQHSESYVAERVLLRWRQLAAATHGVLNQMGEEYVTLVEAIEKTRGTVIVAKGRLSETDGQKPLSALTAGVRREISAVNDRLGSVVTKLATEVPREEASAR